MTHRSLWLVTLLLACKSAPPPEPPAPPAPTEAAPVNAATVTPPVAADAPIWQSAAILEGKCKATLAEIEVIRGEIKAGAPDTLAAYDRMLAKVDRLSGWLDLSANVSPEETVRNAAEACQRSLGTLVNDLNLDRGLYDRVAAIEVERLNPLGQRSTALILRTFKRAGVSQDEATRQKLKALYDEMVKVGQDFDRAIRDDVRTIEVDPSELKGLPEDFIKGHPVGENGKVKLTTNNPDFLPVSTYAESESLRKALYVAFQSRAAETNPQNLKKLLELRHTYATTLGYPSWAAYMAEDKMVKTAATIEKFLGDVAQVARPRMNADLKELLARKKKDDKKAKQIEGWDRFYYVEKVRAEKFGFDARAVRPYFEYNAVTAGLMDLYGELFAVRFVKDTEAPRWHPDVEAYQLWQGDKQLGRFYLDMHPRPNKYGHAAMFPLQTGLSDGTLAIGALVCNFPDPKTSQGPALMEHDQVVTYFHEFGHLVHQLLATGSPYVNLGGTNVEWDFVEAPSQLLEEWARDATVLARFAHHVESKEPIPAALVQKLRESAEFGKGTAVMRQVFYASLSFQLHNQKPDGLDLDKVTVALEKQYSPYPHAAGTRMYASFGHLQSYSSMYYTYQWSLSLAKDIYTRFQKAGLLDPATAAAYRTEILSPGGSRDASELVASFLGRTTNLEAYRAWLQSK
jgi:thimet oligopeptidase